MPTYEYVCEACGHRFERLQKISDRPVRTCPECRRRRAKRLISPGGGLVFRGPGFYATDYRKGPRPREDAGEGKKKADPGKTTSGANGDGNGAADA